jgi:hypothetical protein
MKIMKMLWRNKVVFEFFGQFNKIDSSEWRKIVCAPNPKGTCMNVKNNSPAPRQKTKQSRLGQSLLE